MKYKMLKLNYFLIICLLPILTESKVIPKLIEHPEEQQLQQQQLTAVNSFDDLFLKFPKLKTYKNIFFNEDVKLFLFNSHDWRNDFLSIVYSDLIIEFINNLSITRNFYPKNVTNEIVDNFLNTNHIEIEEFCENFTPQQIRNNSKFIDIVNDFYDTIKHKDFCTRYCIMSGSGGGVGGTTKADDKNKNVKYICKYIFYVEHLINVYSNQEQNKESPEIPSDKTDSQLRQPAQIHTTADTDKKPTDDSLKLKIQPKTFSNNKSAEIDKKNILILSNILKNNINGEEMNNVFKADVPLTKVQSLNEMILAENHQKENNSNAMSNLESIVHESEIPIKPNTAGVSVTTGNSTRKVGVVADVAVVATAALSPSKSDAVVAPAVSDVSADIRNNGNIDQKNISENKEIDKNDKINDDETKINDYDSQASQEQKQSDPLFDQDNESEKDDNPIGFDDDSDIFNEDILDKDKTDGDDGGGDGVKPIIASPAKDQLLKSDLLSDQQNIEIIKDPFVEDTDSNFFSYFMFIMFMCVIIYVIYHNKSKILGLILEGRRSNYTSSGTGGRNGGIGRRKHTAAYRKLDSNLEEAITSSTSSNTTGKSTQIIY